MIIYFNNFSKSKINNNLVINNFRYLIIINKPYYITNYINIWIEVFLYKQFYFLHYFFYLNIMIYII